jgi:transposase
MRGPIDHSWDLYPVSAPTRGEIGSTDPELATDPQLFASRGTPPEPNSGDRRNRATQNWLLGCQARSGVDPVWWTLVFRPFGGVVLLDSVSLNLKENGVGRRGYPPEFRRKVLDLVEAGRPIAEVAQALGISGQSIYTWRRQDRIDRRLEPGLTSTEKIELVAAKRRIAELESELQAMRRAMELVREVVPQKGGSRRSR